MADRQRDQHGHRRQAGPDCLRCGEGGTGVLLPGLGWRAGQHRDHRQLRRPGPTETKLFRDTNPEGSASAARHLAGIPVGRFGQPHELAAAICFLLSEDAGFITGQTLRVDGSIGAA
ncbi:MAG: hypothetical protein QOC74_3811 [Pseudonocardiales bacterium]|nr:hypothetical protein [Pseudonocardiales bacterium]